MAWVIRLKLRAWFGLVDPNTSYNFFVIELFLLHCIVLCGLDCLCKLVVYFHLTFCMQLLYFSIMHNNLQTSHMQKNIKTIKMRQDIAYVVVFLNNDFVFQLMKCL